MITPMVDTTTALTRWIGDHSGHLPVRIADPVTRLLRHNVYPGY